MVRSFPKNPRLENPHLLLMAREVKRPCLLGSPMCVAGSRLTQCCACHGNSSVYNKGRGLKAHDFFSVWGCARCHHWLDESYVASRQERQEVFRAGLGRQIFHWSLIAIDPGAVRKDIEAAQWALEHLIVRGYADSDPSLFAVPTYGNEQTAA